MEETKEFRHAVRVVLKRQMRNLLNQLEEVGEEVAVLTVNVDDRSCFHLASKVGEGFLSEQHHLTNTFLAYCQKYKKGPENRSLLEPDEFSVTPNGTSPTIGPTIGPAIGPAIEPAIGPAIESTIRPAMKPAIRSTIRSTIKPAIGPTITPAMEPAIRSTIVSTIKPAIGPTIRPAMEPAMEPAIRSTIRSTIKPAIDPTITPAMEPAMEPAIRSTIVSTIKPAIGPTITPAMEPAIRSTIVSTIKPAIGPTIKPAQSKTEAKSSPKKTAKRASSVIGTDKASVKKQNQPSPAVATRSGRKISKRYFENIQLLSSKPKRQKNTEPDSQEDVNDKDPAETLSTRLRSKKGSELSLHDANTGDDVDSNSEMPRDDDKKDNSADADPNVEPPVTVLSPAMPAPFPSVEERIKKLKMKHDRSIVDKTPFECNHCGVYIRGRSNLRAHILRVHHQQKKHKCHVCGISFYDRASLENHKLGVHTRQCEQCRQYVTEVEPWKEGVTNRTQRRVRCICGAEVVIVSSYGRSSNKAGKTGDQNDDDSKDTTYACDTCGKLFLTKDQCRRHSRCHSFILSYVCDVCGRSFKYGRSLKYHMEKEHGVMSLVCDICGKSYSNESSLKVHMSKAHVRCTKRKMDKCVQDEQSSEAEDVSANVSPSTNVGQDLQGSSETQTDDV